MQQGQTLLQQVIEENNASGSNDRFMLRDKMKQIQAEMVKLTFEAEMDKRLFAFFSTQLKKVKKQLSLL